MPVSSDSGLAPARRTAWAFDQAIADGVRLFAASGRSLRSRLFSYLWMALIGCFVAGPAVSVLWFAAMWVGAQASVDLTRRIQAVPGGPGVWRPRLLLGVNVANHALTAAMQLALWLSGGALAQTGAAVLMTISGAYVLMFYYSNVTVFVALLTPYALCLSYVAAATVGAHGLTAVAVAVLAAMAANLVTFFSQSRTMLDMSRTALRRARARAQHGEAEAEKANTAKSAFLATMSHEIRTPLNGVLGMAQAMAQDPLSKMQRQRLGVIRQSGEALLAILNDVLDLSKIEAGKIELEDIDFDLGELVQGSHSAFTAMANKKGLSFALDLGDARGIYRGDPTRLRQILYNLISNALKFTEHGEIRVTAGYLDGMLRLSVADTGVGIAAETLPYLFDKFTQADATTTRRFGGTGLGLAICRQLAELMGGGVEVQSEPGRGSVFTFYAPLARSDADAAPATAACEPQPAPPPPQADRAVRVLAAEDNSVNQLVLKTLLYQLGIEPVLADDGQAALQAWEAQDWDVILMDVQMPRMDGLSATRNIRQREAETGRARTPIIALTANTMSDQVAAYLAAGMDSHIAKPIEVTRLFSVLRAIFEDEPDSAAA